MSALVGCYQAKIVGVGEGDDLLAVQVVPVVGLGLQELDDGVEHHEENDGTEGIALKNTFAEWELACAVGLSENPGLLVGVEGVDVELNLGGEVEPAEGVLDKWVGDGSEGILEVEEGDMGGLGVVFGGLYNLIQNNVVFYTTINSREESFLQGFINKVVCS